MEKKSFINKYTSYGKATSSLIFKKFSSTMASFGLIMWDVAILCCYVCIDRNPSHSFFLILFIIFIHFLYSTMKCDSLNEEENSTAMECTFQTPKKNWYYFIGLEKKRNNIYIRRNGKFTWKCLRLVIIPNRDHFLSFFLSLSLTLLFKLLFIFFLIYNRVQFQIMIKLKQFVVLFQSFTRWHKLFLAVDGLSGKKTSFQKLCALYALFRERKKRRKKIQQCLEKF